MAEPADTAALEVLVTITVLAFAAASRIPFERLSIPFTVTSPSRVTLFELLIVRFEKVFAATNWAPAPFSSTVDPALSVSPPVAVIFPATAPEALVEPSLIVPPLLTTAVPAPEMARVLQSSVPFTFTVLVVATGKLLLSVSEAPLLTAQLIFVLVKVPALCVNVLPVPVKFTEDVALLLVNVPPV